MRKSIVKLLKIFGLLCLVAFVCDVCHEWIKLKPYNQAPLKINTFDGTDSPYHPSVRYFENSWNNFKYWMTETPFYPYGELYRDRNECPCIHVSNDGVHWSDNIQNPIDDLDSVGVCDLDYYSDPHLVLVGDSLECWYRLSKRHGDETERSIVYLLAKKTGDGIHWSNRDTLFDFSKFQYTEFVSPAITYSDSIYKMWYVDNGKVCYMQSKCPKMWQNVQICELKGYDCRPWHIDVLEENGIYWLLCYDLVRNNLTLWKSADKTKFSFVKVILEPSFAIGSFYQTMLYRSCMLKQSDDCYRVYFSANNEEITFVGLLEGSSLMDLHVVDIDGCGYSGFPQFLKYYFLTRWRSIYFHYRHLNG